MSALDRLVDALRAAVPAGSPELERLEDVLHVVQMDDSDAAVADCDRLNEAAGAQLPLPERLRTMMLTMQTGR